VYYLATTREELDDTYQHLAAFRFGESSEAQTSAQ